MKGLLLTAILAFSLTSCATRTVVVYEEPPTAKVEIKTTSPGVNYIWVDGHWERKHGKWVWVSGHWVKRPKKQSVWVPGHWAKKRGGWAWISGHWK